MNLKRLFDRTVVLGIIGAVGAALWYAIRLVAGP